MLSCQVAILLIADNSSQKLARELEKDPPLVDIYCYLTDGKMPQRKLILPLAEFKMKDDVLYRLHLRDRSCYQ